MKRSNPSGGRVRLRLSRSILTNPAVIYSAVWLGVLACISVRWIAFSQPVTRRFVILVCGNVVISFLMYGVAVVSMKLRRRVVHASTQINFPRTLTNLRRYADTLFTVWAIGSIVNIAASGGLPILWLLRGDSRSYADYGIWTVSGLLAACAYFAAVSYILLIVAGARYKRWWAIGLIFLYHLLTINRGGIVWLAIEMLGVFAQIGRLRFRRVVALGLAIVLIVLVFGVVGDLRSGGRSPEFMASTLSPDGMRIFERLPTGFWWAYLYASVGAINLNGAMETVSPRGYPYWSVFTLFPSVVRVLVYPVQVSAYEDRYPLRMVSLSFNVFTLYGGYLADYGLTGCFAVTAIIQLLASYWCVKARSGDAGAIVAYAVSLQIIVTSLFNDNFTSWVALFQFFLAFMFRYYSREINHRAWMRRRESDPAIGDAVDGMRVST